MKKMLSWCTLVCLVCALLFSLGLSAGADATAVPNPQYQQPQLTVNKITARPLIDGKLEEETWKQATPIPFTKEALMAGPGQVWSYEQEPGAFEPLPPDGEGTAYVAWDEEYVYFALAIKDEANVSPEAAESYLWKGDGLLMQIASEGSAKGYALGFALGSHPKIKIKSYQWLPYEDELERKAALTDMSKNIPDRYYYYVDRQRDITTYEVALHHTVFGREGDMQVGDTLHFSFAVSLYSDEPHPTRLGETKRYFLEWGKGLIGAEKEGGINGAGVLTLGAATATPTTTTPTTTTPTTTVAPTTSTTRATTTAATTTGATTVETTVDTAPSSTPTSTAIPTEGGEVTTTKDTTTAVTTTVADKAADTTSGSDEKSGFPWGILLAVAAVAVLALGTPLLIKKFKK